MKTQSRQIHQSFLCSSQSHNFFLFLSLVGSQQKVPKILLRALLCLFICERFFNIKVAQNTHTQNLPITVYTASTAP